MASSTPARTPAAGQPNKSDIGQATALLSDLALAASDANALCFHFQPNPEDSDHYELHIRMLRETIKRMGWLADLCATTLGSHPLIGNAEGWFAPSTYHFKQAETP